MLKPLYNTFDIHNSMTENKHATIYLGHRTKKRIDNYAREHDISRSSVIKLAVHDFLTRMESMTEKIDNKGKGLS